MAGEVGVRLDGRRALVTGATRGIGATVAEALAAAGADLVLSARSADELGRTCERLSAAHGVRATSITADLADAADVGRLAEAALASYRGLDILVNNAGVSFPEPVTELSLEAWNATMDVNVRAPALLSRAIGAAMADAGHGRIVNVASAAGLRALRDHAAYCASKAALVMLTNVLALELGPHGVRTNVVCPTIVLTEMGTRVWGDEATAAPMLARIPAGRFAAPDEAAAAVLYLASSAADMLNGVALPVDGGYLVS